MDFPMPRPRRNELNGAGVTRTAGRVKTAGKSLSARTGRLRLAWRFILVTVLVCLAALIWLNQTSTLVSLGYNIEKMNKQEIQLGRQAEELQSQVARYENLQQIENEARTKLGMIPSKQVVYVKVPAGQTTTDQTKTSSGELSPVTDWWRDLSGLLPRSTHAGSNK